MKTYRCAFTCRADQLEPLLGLLLPEVHQLSIVESDKTKTTTLPTTTQSLPAKRFLNNPTLSKLRPKNIFTQPAVCLVMKNTPDLFSRKAVREILRMNNYSENSASPMLSHLERENIVRRTKDGDFEKNSDLIAKLQA
jgi:hypothetical protein